MKRLITALFALGIGAAIVGCEASVKADPDRDTVRTSSGSYEKKTTTVREPDGDVKTKTEVNRY
jgi:hypothetical protein